MHCMAEIDREYKLATLSSFGLSAPEIALAEAIERPGQALDELAIMARRKAQAVKDFMKYRELGARRRRRATR
jgi:hypothetical protein